MSATLERRVMAKAKGQAGRDDVAVKLDRQVFSMAKMVAAARGLTLAEYLSERLRDPVAQDFAQAMRELESRRSPAPKSRKGDREGPSR